MARTNKQESPIIRLTRFEIQIALPEKRSKEAPKHENWTLFGVDAKANERVYV